MRDISVIFAIDDEIEAELDQLLPLFQNYESPVNGGHPFSCLDKDQLFRLIVQVGCIPYAKDKIRYTKEAFQDLGVSVLM